MAIEVPVPVASNDIERSRKERQNSVFIEYYHNQMFIIITRVGGRGPLFVCGLLVRPSLHYLFFVYIL
jgi:hypothetical protein